MPVSEMSEAIHTVPDLASSKSRKTVKLRHAAECLDVIRQGSRSFHFASLVLPRDIRMAAASLYAFCRVSDDLVDDPRATLEAAHRLRERLALAYEGRPIDHIADRAFAEVVEAYDIPQSVPLSMIEGFEWDLTGKRYETIGDVIDYGARVAGTVGVMMSLVMHRRSPRTLARACDLGVAMQLINIARDVGEDARNGRVYLPADWLAEAGLNVEELMKNPQHSDALASVVERLLDEADAIFERARTGFADLPASCRPGIRAAGFVYAGIGTQVRANGFNSVDHRAFTTRRQKLRLLLRALSVAEINGACDETPALAETSYLVDAAADHSADPRSRGEWLVDLSAKLHQHDRRPTRVQS
ncbi:phytoene/squalene synthase family protein [Ahrensia sp. R2A130]|uniref:phytoene/squalene synthase family protein n=1 Tax=Ahrensia sp. R2A130 TaxID=744979 RepID=UPI0002E3F648|nr:phytoene/squalene synthase family protein [Ahrensia sp. R2A130]